MSLSQKPNQNESSHERKPNVREKTKRLSERQTPSTTKKELAELASRVEEGRDVEVGSTQYAVGGEKQEVLVHKVLEKHPDLKKEYLSVNEDTEELIADIPLTAENEKQFGSSCGLCRVTPSGDLEPLPDWSNYLAGTDDPLFEEGANDFVDHGGFIVS